jgi:thiol-disulfide isomerase/thioredoxin
MAKARMSGGLVAAGLLLAWGAATAGAAPTVAQMLSIKPSQAGVVCTTPSPEEQKTCKVELVSGIRAGSSGWLLRDAGGRPLRRFFDTNGDKKIDVWSFYKDGVEVYREIDTVGTGQANQYRWVNAGGTRWGVDGDGHGKMDSWKVISPEEISQELFQALATRDAGRFKALLITDADLRTLKLPAAEADRIRTLVGKAAAKFQSTLAKLPEKAQWGGLENATPHCIPADTLGSDQDLIKFPSRTIRYDFGDKGHEWLQTGEMIQVGAAWKLVDGPTPGAADDSTQGTAGKAAADPELQKLLKDLAEIDASAPQADTSAGPNPKVLRYNRSRAGVIQRIVDRAKAEDKEQWLKQLADCLSAAAQNSPAKDRTSLEQLGKLRERVAKDMPGTALAAYITFREMWADYSPKLAEGGPQLAKVQEHWAEQLKKFVQDYPSAEDAPDALLQLAMGCEFKGKDGEAEAKKWYQQLAGNFENHALAAKARGALRRLDLEGKPLELAGTTLTGSTFDFSRARGKVIVVYYWASYCQQCPGDFGKLKQLLANQGAKGVELVCVNLDDNKDDATRFLKEQPVQAVHLYQAGGLNSPLATQYGILGLPNLFLVGKDHKVISRTVQINDLEDEVKKQLGR